MEFRELLVGVTLLSPTVSSEEAMRFAFAALDDDGNGSISLRDLAKALRSHSRYFTKHDIHALFAAMDLNADGTISYGNLSVSFLLLITVLSDC